MALIRAIFKLSGNTPSFRDFENNTDKELATHIEESLRKRVSISRCYSSKVKYAGTFLANKSNWHWSLEL